MRLSRGRSGVVMAEIDRGAMAMKHATKPYFDTVVIGDKIVTHLGTIRAAIGIRDGRVAGILHPEDVDTSRTHDLIDATGMVVLPGIVDAHVHHQSLDDMADSWESVTEAAAAGGVTTVIPYMKGPSELPFVPMLEQHRADGQRRSRVDFAMHCRLPGPNDTNLGDLARVAELGVTSFKAFMAHRKPETVWDGANLAQLMQAVARVGGVLCLHAEDSDIINHLEGVQSLGGQITEATYERTRPVSSEAAAAFKAACLAGETQCPVYLVHTSTPQVLDAVKLARRLAGGQVAVETCPHYLTLSNQDLLNQGGRAKIAPPLRVSESLNDLWAALASNAIDVVASDHGPWPPAMKLRPRADFADVPHGAPGVETLLPVLFSEGVMKGRISLSQLAEVLSAAPARIFGLAPRKGSIQPGADADLVIVDPNLNWEVDDSSVRSQSGYSLWHGWQLRGKPVLSMLRGSRLLDGDSVLGEPGHGRYLPRLPRSRVTADLPL